MIRNYESILIEMSELQLLYSIKSVVLIIKVVIRSVSQLILLCFDYGNYYSVIISVCKSQLNTILFQ